jgi:HK97 family phage major capsid protein
LKEDQCGFTGDGTSTYGGITGAINKLLNLSATIANIAGIRVQATISTGTFASAILGDFQATIAKLPKYADTPKAKWYMHKTFYHSVPATLMVAAGGNAISDLQGGARQQTFLGYPVEFCQVMPSVWVANQIFALFGDLSLAASFGDRRSTTLFSDPYSLAANDQVQIRGTERFDINIHDVGNASGTAALRVPGPVVAFASAAS